MLSIAALTISSFSFFTSLLIFSLSWSVVLGMGSEYTRSFRYPQRKNQLGLGLGCREASWSQPSGRWFSLQISPQARTGSHRCNVGEPYPAGSSKYQESSSFWVQGWTYPEAWRCNWLSWLSQPSPLRPRRNGVQRSLVAETHPDGYLFPGLKTLVSRIRLLIWPDRALCVLMVFRCIFLALSPYLCCNARLALVQLLPLA